MPSSTATRKRSQRADDIDETPEDSDDLDFDDLDDDTEDDDYEDETRMTSMTRRRVRTASLPMSRMTLKRRMTMSLFPSCGTTTSM